MFLERLINDHLETVLAVHEPRATRYQMMLANLRNDWGIGGGILQRIFERSRARRLNAGGSVYVEINPFLCAMTDLLPRPGHALRIVHLVRDPASWAGSITTFKASTRFRNIIDHVPFAKPYPSPRPEGWRSMNEYERALWRWNWCNQCIGNLRNVAQAYALVRYEDFFAREAETRTVALEAIGSALDLPGRFSVGDQEMTVRRNMSSEDDREIDKKAASRICGDLARTYGYEY